eukprot:GCRY01000029.1.p1 GENE.GCRY01000029.1~~GCRY01000029.1.p1  ORF type:complete len:149 (-),score=20.04 GCRY01000029.1:56-436(-)
MSWQAYVDTSLVGTGFCTKACIVGLDGNVWATSAGFGAQGNEGKSLVSAFTDPSGVLASGLHFGGEKYMTIKADPRSVYGKKGAAGVCCVKTTQCVLVGVYDDKIQPGQCAACVEKLADYLIELGY